MQTTVATRKGLNVFHTAASFLTRLYRVNRLRTRYILKNAWQSLDGENFSARNEHSLFDLVYSSKFMF